MSDRGVSQGGVLEPQQIIDAALSAASAEGCIVVVQSGTEANVRWANNTVTTNGLARTLSWFVVAFSGGAAGTVAASAASADSVQSVAEVVQAAQRAADAAARAGRAQDEQPLMTPTSGGDLDFDEPAVSTTFDVFGELLGSLANGFDAARSGDRILYGFARHEVTTTYLGSSTGLRLRWVQPTGLLEVNAKSADLSRSAWAGLSTADFVGVDVAAVDATLAGRLEWARRSIDLPPGRYDTVLPPTAVADFLIYLAWSAGARPAHEGRSAFSAPGGGTRLGERLTDRPFTLFSDPRAAGLEAAPFLVTAHSGDEVSVFDNGASIGRVDILADGVIANLLHTRGSAAEYHEPFTPVLRQSGPDRWRSGPRDRRSGGGCPTWAAGDVAVVSAGRRPDDAAADRPDPGRRLPHRERRDRRCGQQFPVQHVAARPAQAGVRRRPHRAGAVPRVE